VSEDDPTLQVQEWTTPDGQAVRVAYDPAADVLEVYFPGLDANDAVDLTEHITLHFDSQHHRGTGITFLGYRQLSRAGEWGAPTFAMTGLDRLPVALRSSIITILNTSPVDQFLRTATLIAPQAEARPILALQPPWPIAV
jgi:hypothetical protein